MEDKCIGDKNSLNLRRFLFYIISMMTNEKKYFNIMHSHNTPFTDK